jgi:hypothetical protein
VGAAHHVGAVSDVWRLTGDVVVETKVFVGLTRPIVTSIVWLAPRLLSLLMLCAIRYLLEVVADDARRQLQSAERRAALQVDKDNPMTRPAQGIQKSRAAG